MVKMTRLPKKYFASITDYVNTYYTAWGAANFAEKAYNAVKTVTKDFTRTDPVHVRIGADGEPEIHYTMTQASGGRFFYGMDIGKATLHIHNMGVLTSLSEMCGRTQCAKIVCHGALNPNVKSLNFSFYGSDQHLYDGTLPSEVVWDDAETGNVINFQGFFGANRNLKKIPWFDTSSSRHFLDAWATSIIEYPAYDFSAVTNSSSTAFYMPNCTAFHAYGMRVSFNLAGTSLAHDAILEVFNNLGEALENATLTLGATKLALMSDEEKAIATGKGWTLA